MDPRLLSFTGASGELEFDAAVLGAGAFYHSFYFDNGFQVRGDYDIGRDISDYGLSDDLSGLRVLDIGAASGWFSFYFEQLGADVTAFELRSPNDWDTFGPYEWPRPEETAGEWMPSFRVMHELLGSRVERVFGRVYEISPSTFEQPFDLVFMGAILLHLRDPIGALSAARSVCRNRLVATNWFIPDGEFAPDALIADWPLRTRSESGNVWWRPTRAAFAAWCHAAGFAAVDVSRTVTLTADLVIPRRNNGTQTMLLADARIR